MSDGSGHAMARRVAVVTTMLALIATAVLAAVVVAHGLTAPARHGTIGFTPGGTFRGGVAYEPVSAH